MAIQDRTQVIQNQSVQEPIEKIILHSLNEGVITVECSGMIHAVNPAALRILGFREDEVKERNCRDVFHDPENATFNNLVVQLVQTGTETRHEETHYKRPDGQVIDLSVETSFLAVKECSLGLQSVVLVFRDITPLKSLERVRRLAVDHLAHELKTPLAIIQASVELLSRNNYVDDKSSRDLQRIVRNVGRLRNMQLVVEEILDPPPYRPEAMCVRVAVENMLAKLRRASAHRKVRLAADLEDLQSEILDSNILSIVLETLVKNAIENTPDGGVVTVAVRPVQEGILFQVRDTGVGIPLGDQAFIFQGFHHTQRSEDYSSKRPFEFNAGGKGLELLRLKVLSKLGYFDISFESTRCISLPTRENLCSGEIAACSHASEVQRCPENGGTTFSVLFHERELREKYVRQKGPISDSQS